MKRRTTATQTEILTLLEAANTALSHEMVQSELGANMDRATIYRVLNRFCEDGRVHRIVGDDGKQYFALCLNCGELRESHTHNHFHFRCLECGKVECLKHDIKVPLPDGYTSERFNGFISGRCKNCS